MKKIGIITTFILCICLISSISVSTNNNQNQRYIKTVEFSAENETDNIPEFDKDIIKDGVEYTLSGVDVETVSREPKTLTNYFSKDIETIFPENQEYEPEDSFIEDGVLYVLSDINSELVDNVATYKQEVTGFNDYDHTVTEADVPQTKVITVNSIATGDPVEVTCNLENIIPNGGGWQQNTISIVFYNIGADMYEWNGITVPGNQEIPLIGYEQELLESVGADSSSRVVDIYWVSEPYYDDLGQICRNAQADIEQYVQYYRANYRGTFQAEEPGVRYIATYEGNYTENSDTDFTYKRRATATYEVKSENQHIDPLIIAGIGISLCVAIVLVILVLYILSKKKKKKGAA